MVPIVAIFTVAINVEPFAVAISAIALFCGGLLRMAYAMLFEDHYETAPNFLHAITGTIMLFLGRVNIYIGTTKEAEQDMNAIKPSFGYV